MRLVPSGNAKCNLLAAHAGAVVDLIRIITFYGEPPKLNRINIKFI
jgi:hypothetical protein